VEALVNYITLHCIALHCIALHFIAYRTTVGDSSEHFLRSTIVLLCVRADWVYCICMHGSIGCGPGYWILLYNCELLLNDVLNDCEFVFYLYNFTILLRIVFRKKKLLYV
jgi:hypothetical protein